MINDEEEPPVMSIRPVKFGSQARPTMEGAGVHLHRVWLAKPTRLTRF